MLLLQKLFFNPVAKHKIGIGQIKNVSVLLLLLNKKLKFLSYVKLLGPVEVEKVIVQTIFLAFLRRKSRWVLNVSLKNFLL